MSLLALAGQGCDEGPPPVDSSKIPDIVKYEARQQIPFPLEEVIWDYQQLAGGTAGLVPCGTTGEAVTMSSAERLRAVRVAQRQPCV